MAAGFDPGDFLTLAKSLLAGDSPTQAQLRTAVSRAYYTAHLAARERLADIGKLAPSGTGQDHLDVIAVLRSMGGSLGHRLDQLRILRNRADYNLHRELHTDETQKAISDAEALIDDIRALSS